LTIICPHYSHLPLLLTAMKIEGYM
jgi:hypothetical protein